MISFDYLHAPRPRLIARLLDVRVPQRLQPALCAFCAILIFIAGAWSIEAYRLNSALAVESLYRLHDEQSRVALAKANVYYERVRDIVEIAKRVREIAASGDEDALRLAAIANALPANAWLTSISHDGSGILLDGNARDLRVVGGAVHGLAHARGLKNPVLVSADADASSGRAASVKYTLRLEADEP